MQAATAATAPPASDRAGAGRLESRDKTSGELIGAVPTIGPADVQTVVDEVAAIQPYWASLPLSERARYLRQAAYAILKSTDQLCELLAREQGKPVTEGYAMEVLPTVDALNWCAREGRQLLADEPIPTRQPYFKTKQSHFVYEPLGVVGVIAPWNYPWSIPMSEVAMALMAGNGVVLKPASLTPLLGEQIRATFERAGVPEGLVRVVHGGGRVGQALAESSVDKVFFTGSVPVGRTVSEICGRTMKRCVLELGGKDPMLVLDDADVGHAVSGALWAGFANAGQSCSGIERVYVMREVADRFVAEVIEGARRLKVGDPHSPETAIGPMTSSDQFRTVCELVEDAVAAGATQHGGGPVEVPGASGDFYAPAVLTGVRPDMRIMREEIFGPVLPITVVDSLDEAIALANDCEFGLGASVWTSDRDRGERVASLLEAGMVWINDHMYSHGACQCSWGGVKDSGLGRTHSKFGFYECVNVKLRVWEPSHTANPWWHPYDATVAKALKTIGALLYGRDADRANALRTGTVSLLKLGRRLARTAVRG